MFFCSLLEVIKEIIFSRKKSLDTDIYFTLENFFKFLLFVFFFVFNFTAVFANSEETSSEEPFLSKYFAEPILDIFDGEDSNKDQSNEETLDDKPTPTSLPDEPLINVDVFGDVESDEDQNELVEEYFDAVNDVKFLLYTPSNPTDGQEISHLNLTTIIDSNYIPNYPTRFYAHGWMSNGNSGKSIRKGTLKSP